MLISSRAQVDRPPKWVPLSLNKDAFIMSSGGTRQRVLVAFNVRNNTIPPSSSPSPTSLCLLGVIVTKSATMPLKRKAAEIQAGDAASAHREAGKEQQNGYVKPTRRRNKHPANHDDSCSDRGQRKPGSHLRHRKMPRSDHRMLMSENRV